VGILGAYRFVLAATASSASSAAPCFPAICGAFKQETYIVSSRTIIFKEVKEREGGDGRDPSLKIMDALVPAVNSRCWPQTLKVFAQIT
jgi:hypothetical protein